MNNRVILFHSPQDIKDWEIVNDQVMGGCSSGSLQWNPEQSMSFSGIIRSDNGGGFASIRRLIPKNTASEGLSICFKGDYTVKLKVRTDPFLDGVDYASFAQGEPDKWTTARIPFGDFKPYFRGLQLPDAAPLAPTDIQQLGLLIGGQQFGPFEIQLRSIELY